MQRISRAVRDTLQHDPYLNLHILLFVSNALKKRVKLVNPYHFLTFCNLSRYANAKCSVLK